MSQRDVTIVLVPRERFSATRRALETLYEHTEYPFSLIYVAGASPPHIRRYLRRQAQARGFTLIESEHYLRSNEARNIGLRLVRTTYAVTMDNDVLVSAGWLEPLLNCAEDTGAAVVGPLTCIGEPEGTVIHSAGGVAHIVDEGDGRRFFHRNFFVNRRLAEVRSQLRREPRETVEFHCMLLRTDILPRVGYLDEDILNDPHHVDFCMTVGRAGGHIYIEPASIVTQLAPPPVKWYDLPYFLLRWSECETDASLTHFCRKWGLAEDDPEIVRYKEWLIHRRRLAYVGVYRTLGRVLGGRMGSWLERAWLSPMEARVNRWLFRVPPRNASAH